MPEPRPVVETVRGPAQPRGAPYPASRGGSRVGVDPRSVEGPPLEVAMRFLTYVLLLATWLFASAFVLSHTVLSALLTVALAVVLLGLALASPGKPALRFGVTAIALVMPFLGIFLPDVSGAVRLNLLLVAPLLFVLSMVKPVHHRFVRPGHEAAPPAGHAGHPHGPLEDEVLARPT